MAITALVEGGYALVAATLGTVEASRRAVARHRAALSQSRTLCEVLSEHLGWLQRPDDQDRVVEVIGAIQSDAAALGVCVGRLAGADNQPGGLVAEELAALVDAIDAEVRLVILGDSSARSRARNLASRLLAGAAGLSRHDAAPPRPRVLRTERRGHDASRGGI